MGTRLNIAERENARLQKELDERNAYEQRRSHRVPLTEGRGAEYRDRSEGEDTEVSFF